MEHTWNPQTLRDIFSSVLQMTDEQLKNIPYLQVRESKSGPGWEAVTGFCCLGGCEPQAKAHAGANLSVGNTRQTLIDALTQCLPFIGFPRTLNAISCIG